MGRDKPCTSRSHSRWRIPMGIFALTIGVFTHGMAVAGQSIDNAGLYVAVDPFDPSEVVTHTLKDDRRLRLRLPAPDLPPSIVVSTPTRNAAAVEMATSPTASSPPVPVAVDRKNEPGLIQKSVQSVMSIFDWSDDKADTTASGSNDPTKSHEPIRINIHVGIIKPEPPKGRRNTQPAITLGAHPGSRAQSVYHWSGRHTRLDPLASLNLLILTSP